MKTTLILSLITGALCTNAFPQGTVTFSAPRGSLRYTFDGTELPVPAGSPATIPYAGQFNLALYAAPQGTTIPTVFGIPDLSGWTLTTILSTVAPFDGTIPYTVVTIPPALSGAAGGNTVQLEVVAWTGQSRNFEEALDRGEYLLAWSGDPKSGGALGWSQPTGTAIPPTTVFVSSGENAFNGLVLSIVIPEPSAFAIAALGAALLLLRRPPISPSSPIQNTSHCRGSLLHSEQKPLPRKS